MKVSTGTETIRNDHRLVKSGMRNAGFVLTIILVGFVAVLASLAAGDETDGRLNALADTIMRNLGAKPATCPADFALFQDLLVVFCGKVPKPLSDHPDHVLLMIDGVLATAAPGDGAEAWSGLQGEVRVRSHPVGDTALSVLVHRGKGKVVISYPRRFDDCPEVEIAGPPPGAEVTPPSLVPESRVWPAYPAAAGVARVHGLAIVQAVIRADGTVGDACSPKASPANLGFGEAAVAAVRQWRFEPCTSEGEPVACRYNAVIDFNPVMVRWRKKGLD